MRSAFMVLVATLIIGNTALAQGLFPYEVDAEQRYADAVDTTRGLPEPPFVTYSATVRSTTAAFAIVPGADGYARVTTGSAANGMSTSSWDGRFRARDDRAIVVVDGKPLVGLSPLFDPTWYGARDWLRHGLESLPVPLPSAEPRKLPHPAASGELPVIATVSAINWGDYSVTRVQPEKCLASNFIGDHLQLSARDPDTNPLTDVIIDIATRRFCTMRFRIPAGSATSGGGYFELSFGDV